MHVDSYLDKEHCSVFFPAEFRVMFTTKTNEKGLCFLTVMLCKNLYEILANETAFGGVNNKRHCMIKFDNILGAWVRRARVVEICRMVCFAAQTKITKQLKFSHWNCYHCLELEKRYFLAEINTCVAVFLGGKICLSRDLAWLVVYLGVRTIMSTSMFLLLLVNVLCFAQNLRCTTSVSCDLKSSEFEEVCYKTFLRRSSCCVVFWRLVRKYRDGFVAGKLRKGDSSMFKMFRHIYSTLKELSVKLASNELNTICYSRDLSTVYRLQLDNWKDI